MHVKLSHLSAVDCRCVVLDAKGAGERSFMLLIKVELGLGKRDIVSGWRPRVRCPWRGLSCRGGHHVDSENDIMAILRMTSWGF